MGILWAVVALIALGFIAGIIGWIQNIFKQKRIAAGLETEDDIAPTQPASSGGCCGMHMTCERDSLLAAVSTSIVYYDDEELDAYKGLSSRDYDERTTDEFRDILITLDADDVAGWVRSLQLRGIELPEELKPEVFLIVGESRAYHMEHGPDDHNHPRQSA